MIVIESGGTKSTWVFKSVSDEIQSIETVGLHPQELSHEKENTICALIGENNLIKEDVYFYGAGCESPESKVKITSFLEDLGLKVNQVQTDIYGACLAQLGFEEGVVGILGTGAVAAQFDGSNVVRQTSGLGYILGDEGSGFDIGKRLLQKRFSGGLTQNITDAINLYFNHEPILHVIHGDGGRMRIAGLTKIVYQFRSEEVINEVLLAAFDEFCVKALSPLGREHPVHFIGSIAFYFQEELKESLLRAGFQMGGVEKEAVYGVFDFLSAQSKD